MFWAVRQQCHFILKLLFHIAKLKTVNLNYCFPKQVHIESFTSAPVTQLTNDPQNNW